MPIFHSLSIGREGVLYNAPDQEAPADGCGMIAVGMDLVFTDSPVATQQYVDDAIAEIELTPGPAGANGATGPAGPNLISGSTATALLGLLYANGSNVAVASAANVIAALGYTPANRAGDTTGPLTITGPLTSTNASHPLGTVVIKQGSSGGILGSTASQVAFFSRFSDGLEMLAIGCDNAGTPQIKSLFGAGIDLVYGASLYAAADQFYANQSLSNSGFASRNRANNADAPITGSAITASGRLTASRSAEAFYVPVNQSWIGFDTGSNYFGGTTYFRDSGGGTTGATINGATGAITASRFGLSTIGLSQVNDRLVVSNSNIANPLFGIDLLFSGGDQAPGIRWTSNTIHGPSSYYDFSSYRGSSGPLTLSAVSGSGSTSNTVLSIARNSGTTTINTFGGSITSGAITASSVSITTLSPSALSLFPGGSYTIGVNAWEMPFRSGGGYTFLAVNPANLGYAYRFGTNALPAAVQINSDGSLATREITASGITRSGVFTVATLPSASANPGFEAVATDSSVTTNGSPVAGGGSARVKVFSNGSTWDVMVA